MKKIHVIFFLSGLLSLPLFPQENSDTAFLGTPSGLQYLLLSPGRAPHADDGYRVTFHLCGVTASGDTFVNTFAKGHPLSLIVGTGQMIPGLDEGIRLCGTGGEIVLRVPAHLGYEDKGTGDVPPGSDLLLHVKILKVSDHPLVIVPYRPVGRDTLITPKGVRYILLRRGPGPLPRRNDSITLHYTGYLIDGKVFDSSLLRGQPFSFRLGDPGIIRGWNEVFPYLPLGTKARIIIPWKMAYGKKGQPPRIPPKSDLIFDVEILQIK